MENSYYCGCKRSDRLAIWKKYYEGLSELAMQGCIELPSIVEECTHNAHMFYIKVNGCDERAKLISHLSKSSIMTVFHYIPLHSSIGGEKFARFDGQDIYTTIESERILRLPMYFGLKNEEVKEVISSIKRFFSR